jgi:uncharacterized membrane protein
MRKIWIACIMIPVVVGLFFAGTYFWSIPLGEANLRVELSPTPPWRVKPGQTIQLIVKVINDAWLFSPAKNVRGTIVVPQNFTVHSSGTDKSALYLDVLKGGEGQSTPFNITAAYDISPGNYTLTIKVSADNAVQQSITGKLIVEKFTFIP